MLRIRVAAPSDEASLEAFLDRIDGARRPSGFEAADLVPPRDAFSCASAPDLGCVFVALSGRDGVPEVVGAAAWCPIAGADAQAALAVADGWRLGDVGDRLVAALAASARGRGFARFVIEVVPHNAALRASARRLGMGERRRMDGRIVEVEITIDQTRPRLGGSRARASGGGDR